MTISISKPLALLGGLSPKRFMRAHWQKDFALIRQSIANFQGVVTPRDVLKLATQDDVPSRLIIRDGKTWHVEHGPFSAKALRSLPPKNWTILVQDLNLIVPEADALMRQFAFIPYARLDDVMVSLAAPGGGVGPHFDSYDVFLLQGLGRRRWQISGQTDLSLREDAPLKILKRFKSEQEWTLNPGDMLYLPPRFAHDGVALDTCLTFSIGFRAPTPHEILAAAMESIIDDDALRAKPHVGDANLSATQAPARLPREYIAAFGDAIQSTKWTASRIETIAGVFATTPKSHVFFDAPMEEMTFTQFARALKMRTLMLAPQTLASYSKSAVFINGEAFGFDPQIADFFDARKILCNAAISASTIKRLFEWYRSSWVLFK